MQSFEEFPFKMHAHTLFNECGGGRHYSVYIYHIYGHVGFTDMLNIYQTGKVCENPTTIYCNTRLLMVILQKSIYSDLFTPIDTKE